MICSTAIRFSSSINQEDTINSTPTWINENLTLLSLTKKFKVGITALSVAASLAIAPLTTQPVYSSAWQNAQVPALTGIKSVAVVVSAHGDGAQRLGLNEAKLQNLVMQQIASAGIPLHNGGPIKDKPDVACFEIDTHLVIVEDASTKRPLGLTYAIEGFILDSVSTKRRAGLSAGTLGILWKASGAHGYLPGEHIRSFGSIVQKVVNEFVQDYYTANGQKAYDATAAKVTKQLPTITLSGSSGTSDSTQLVKNQVASHITPSGATPLQRLIDEQNIAPPMTSYQKPREAARPVAQPPAPAPTPAVALAAPKAKSLQEAVPEDELTADQLALLQAKAQALHQQAINLQHQVLLQQISQLQAQAARLNEKAMAQNASKVDTAAIDMLQKKQAALQKNIAQQASFGQPKQQQPAAPKATGVRPVKKKLIAAQEPSKARATSPGSKAIADASAARSSEAKAKPVSPARPVGRSEDAIKNEAPQASAPRVETQSVTQVVAPPVQQAAPNVAQNPITERSESRPSLAQLIAAQSATDAQPPTIMFNPTAARPVVTAKSTPPTTSVVKPVIKPAVAAKPKPTDGSKPRPAVERDLAPRSGVATAKPVQTTQPAAEHESVLNRAKKKFMRLPWRAENPTTTTTTTSATKNRVL